MSEDLIFITNLPTYKKALYQAVADSCGIDVTFGPAKNFLIEANDHVSVWVAKKDNAERYADAVVDLERYIIRFLKKRHLNEYELEKEGKLADYLDQNNPDGFKITEEMDRGFKFYAVNYQNTRF